MKIIIILAINFMMLAVNTVFAEPAQTHRADATVFVAVPVEQAWAQLQDFGVAHYYVPDLTKTEIVSKVKNGVGAHRKVYDSDGGHIDETIIEWYEGRGFLLRLHQGELPLSSFILSQFSYHLEAEEEGTRVTLSMYYQMPWGFVGEKLNDWLIAGIVADNVANVAAGMKHFYETGQAATDQHRADLLSQVTVNRY